MAVGYPGAVVTDLIVGLVHSTNNVTPRRGDVIITKREKKIMTYYDISIYDAVL